MGLGLGAGLGMMMPSILKDAFKNGREEPKEACPNCSADIPARARFCNNCGHQLITGMKCPSCQNDLPADANFCSNCGAKVREEAHKVCPHCSFENLLEANFCNSCGEKLP